MFFSVLVIDFQFHSIVVREVAWYDFSFLHLLRLLLCPNLWSILENIPCALEKCAHSTVLGWNALKISFKYFWSNVFFKYIYWLCYYSCHISPTSLHSILHTHSLPHFSPIVHVHGSYICSLASTFPILFLTSPVYLYLPFMLLIFCTFSPSLPTHSPNDNPPCDLHFCDYVPVLVVCLICFCFRFGC